MKKITVEITFNDPEDSEAFPDMNAQTIWNAMCRAFPYSMGSHWTVQQIGPVRGDTKRTYHLVVDAEGTILSIFPDGSLSFAQTDANRIEKTRGIDTFVKTVERSEAPTVGGF